MVGGVGKLTSSKVFKSHAGPWIRVVQWHKNCAGSVTGSNKIDSWLVFLFGGCDGL